MASRTTALSSRLEQILFRARIKKLASLWGRARGVAKRFGKTTLGVFADMIREALFHETAFQDYIDWDYAILTREERRTFMTHPISQRIADTTADPQARLVFQDKIAFDRVFAEFLRREWLEVESASVDDIRDFVTRHGRIMGKVPVSDSGHGVERHDAAAITDWTAFREFLLAKGQLLLEELIVQHPYLAAYCPGTVNTTRVTTFFDGERANILFIAQKFGRGAASDQQTFGGFYTLLDIETGKSKGKGYDSHDGVHERHPESGRSIPDFELPLFETLQPFLDRVAAVVPSVPYVGWDIVMTEDGPVLVEGNWGVGVYENKPSVTGIRTGSRPRYRQFVEF